MVWVCNANNRTFIHLWFLCLSNLQKAYDNQVLNRVVSRQKHVMQNRLNNKGRGATNKTGQNRTQRKPQIGKITFVFCPFFLDFWLELAHVFIQPSWNIHTVYFYAKNKSRNQDVTEARPPGSNIFINTSAPFRQFRRVVVSLKLDFFDPELFYHYFLIISNLVTTLK